MKYALYGLPCAGKTTLMSELDIPVIHGSAELNKMASGKFSDLPEDEKNKLRIRYAEGLLTRKDSFISDGHYSFLDNVVFTDADAMLYDVFIYLYCKPEIICERIQSSTKNRRFADLLLEQIRKWQDFEIECLRDQCHKRNKDFYVIDNISSAELQAFINKIENGFSSYTLAETIAERIKRIYPTPCELHICDGDKTIIKQDSFRTCTDNYVTHTFDGNFYTGFQSLRFGEESLKLNYDLKKLDKIQLNDIIYKALYDKNYIVLSSGITEIWNRLGIHLGLKNVIADTLISADTKYFTVKLLQEQGYIITAYGDGKNDLYMLKQADQGYLYIGTYLSRSLMEADISGIGLLYDKSTFILEYERGDIVNDITICKSTSGINGSKLADAHFRLGRQLGEEIHKVIPNTNTAIIVLERGGRFFGDGLYMGFGGMFYSYDAKKDKIPNIKNNITIIVDSVINTGKSIFDTIGKLKQINPDIEIFIAANVIQDRALELLQDYKAFAVRISTNSFVGRRQNMQKDGFGPDTADRLFNYIE